MTCTAKEKIIVALDVPDAVSAISLMEVLRDRVSWVKIGLQLFTASGPGIVEKAKSLGFRVFLDLKFHDIPNTMRHAVRSAIDLGADMTTVHALSGPAALSAVSEESKGSGLQILAVTLLTSMDADEVAGVGLSGLPAENVMALGRLAVNSGVTGLVSSPLEVEGLRNALGPDICLVTPGIRPVGSSAGDQKRLSTPGAAIRAGSDFLVIGRPITEAPNPGLAAEQIAKDLEAEFLHDAES